MKKLTKKPWYKLPLLGLVMASLLLLVFSSNSTFYKSSVISLPEHKSFDGTVYPVNLAPDYVHLRADRYNLPFDSYENSELIEVPLYDANTLKKSINDLKWGVAADDAVRNAKITYSTPYMGNYRLDGVEGAGSHLAVDIKVPSGTPVYSMANGVVIKVTAQDSGFGKHIVIQHNNVPTLNNPNENTVLYSSYSHLNQINVSVNDVVVKGQMIGKSGSTGTSTTPHLHFQIDNANAPWHPYWPFTWKEAADSGLDFFTAINSGLGSDKALATTVNPLMYVQKYLSGSVISTPVVEEKPVVVKDEPIIATEPKKDDVVVIPEILDSYTEPVIAEPVVETVPNEQAVVEPKKLNFVFKLDSLYYSDSEKLEFALSLKDQFGNTFKEGFIGDLLVESVQDNIRINKSLINVMAFDSDKNLTKNFVVRQSGKERLKIVYDGQNFYSDWFEVIKVEKDAIFKDVSSNSEYSEAISYLTDKKVVNGYADGTFKPNNVVSRVEALKLVMKGSSTTLQNGTLSFKDTESGSWYNDYLYTGLQKGIVKGYADGTFKPSNTVNKAEFYKMLFNSAGIKVPDVATYSPFVDVNTGDWYAPYFLKAYEMGVIDKNIKYISPSEDITRGDAAYAIYKALTAI